MRRPPSRPLAGRHGPRRCRSRGTRRAGVPAAGAGRAAGGLETRRPDRGARAAERAIAALGGGSLEVRAGRRRRPRRPLPDRRHGARPRAQPRYPRDRVRRASGGHGERRTARFDRVRIAVVSDIHSNLVALDAVLARAGAVDAIWHLGDIVGYGPEPDAVVERLTSLGAIGVRGNHDSAAAGGTEIDWFNPDARAAMEWTRSVISETTRAWLGACRCDAESGLHARPRQPARPHLGVRDLGGAGARSLVGHLDRDTVSTATPTFRSPSPWSTAGCGRSCRGPAIRSPSAAAALLNPGSVGQPRDGDPRASFLVLDLAAGTATWEPSRLRLRCRAARDARRRAARAGLPIGCGIGSDAA